MKNVLRSLSMGFGLSAIFAAGSLNAAELRSNNLTVPFEFKVEKMTLPAGEYRVEQDFGKSIVSLVNIKTGQRVRMLRDIGDGFPGHAKLEFEPTAQGYKLSKVY